MHGFRGNRIIPETKASSYGNHLEVVSRFFNIDELISRGYRYSDAEVIFPAED